MLFRKIWRIIIIWGAVCIHRFLFFDVCVDVTWWEWIVRSHRRQSLKRGTRWFCYWKFHQCLQLIVWGRGWRGREEKRKKTTFRPLGFLKSGQTWGSPVVKPEEAQWAKRLLSLLFPSPSPSTSYYHYTLFQTCLQLILDLRQTHKFCPWTATGLTRTQTF